MGTISRSAGAPAGTVTTSSSLGFFERFMASLPAQAIENFALRHLSVEGDVALIVWSVGQDLPLGTDTFVVRGDKIARQTFAMHAAPVAQSGQALSHLLRGS